MKKKDIINILVLLVLIGIAVWRLQNKRYEYRKAEILMDTLVDITINSHEKNADVVLDSTFKLIKQYDEKFSYYTKGSKIYNMNHSSDAVFPIDNDIYEMLTVAEDFYTKSDSVYDVTIGALTDLWSIEKRRVPPADSIKTAQEDCGFEKISFTNSALIKPKAVKINLGSIAKGYIIDKAVAFLQAHGIEKGLVNAGGDIRIFGYNKKPLTIAIQHPRKPGDIIAKLNIGNMAVVTSGDYERFFEIDGVIYHHIINPRTGYPAKNTISVTVIAPNATLADAASTACFLMAPAKAVDMIKSIPQTDVMIYYKSLTGDIISLRSEGMKKYLKAFENEN